MNGHSLELHLQTTLCSIIYRQVLHEGTSRRIKISWSTDFKVGTHLLTLKKGISLQLNRINEINLFKMLYYFILPYHYLIDLTRYSQICAKKDTPPPVRVRLAMVLVT